METKEAPVLISSSGSPPTGDGSDHQIIRPTPRRATELVINNSNSNSDQMQRLSNNNIHQDSQDINKVNTIGLPILPSNPPPMTPSSTSSLPLTTVNSFSFPIDEPQSYNSHKQIKSGLSENGHKNDLDYSPRRIVRNNSQQYFDEKRNVFMGIKFDDRPQSQTPTAMLPQADKLKTNNLAEKVSLVRKSSSSSPKNTNNRNFSNNLQPIKMSLTELIPKFHESEKRNTTADHSEQIPVRDTDSAPNKDKNLITGNNVKTKDISDNNVPSSSNGDLVTNVVVDGTSSVPQLSNIPMTSPTNKLSSVMYVSSTGTNEESQEKGGLKSKEINASNDDSGYQILSSKDEEAERDPQKNSAVSPALNSTTKNKKENSKQGRSSLVKYKAYQGRSKPKRKSQGGSSRSRNNVSSKSSSNAHFHSNDSNADDKLTKSLENANRLLDVKNAIEQLKIRSNHHSSNYTNPGYSSNDNDNTSTSSYSSASDDSDHISTTTKGSGMAASISSNSSYPISPPGIQASLQTASSLLSANQQQFEKSYKNENNFSHNINPSSIEHFNNDHIASKNDHQPSQHQQQRSVQNKRGPSHNNVPDEMHNTTVTSADEFVWIDSYNRLVELQKFPWNHTDLCTVISSAQSGRDMTMPPIASSPGGLVGGGIIDQQEHRGLFHSADILPRLSYYLQRALVRIAREAQRLSKPVGKCGRHEVCSAIKIVLTPPLALAAVKACLRATAMYSISTGDGSSIANQKQTKSSRAGLLLHVGKMHRWMCLVKVGRFIHEFAAIYLTAAIETILEELITKCLDIGHRGGDFKLSATLLEQVVAMSSDFWGLFQPYSHLSSCRTSAGLAIPSCLEEYTKTGGSSSMGRSISSHAQSHAPGGKSSSGGTPNSSGRNIQQALLTTCVGSIEELEEMVSLIAPALRKIWNNVGGSTGVSSGGHNNPNRPSSQSTGFFGSRIVLSWNPEAFRTLYHFVRCSQLEYVGQEGRSPIQELIYERPYMVLPPLMEWVRVSSAFAEHRMASYVDSDDTLQAARILLPGMDHPIRPLDMMPTNLGMATALDELEYVNLLKREMAFHMLQTGRRDLVPHALQLLPSAEKLNATNVIGVTSLQLAALRGDYNVVRLLLDTGADVEGKSSTSSENKHWTALNYAALAGHVRIAKLLMDKGSANVEGGAINKEIIQPCETPLMLAAASGSIRMVELLLSYGASPFLSTIEGTNAGFNSFSVGGCHSAISVASAHGHKRILNVLVSQALAPSSNSPENLSLHAPNSTSSPFGAASISNNSSSSSDQVLSLEEILAEGASEDSPASPNVALGPTGTIKQKSSGIKNTNNINSNSPGIENLTSRLGGKGNVRKLQEAMYHACEATNLEVTLDLRNNLGVPWTLHTWLQTLTTANDNTLVGVINELLQDFSTSWAEEQSSYFLDVGLPLLFSIFRNSKTEGTVLLLADIFSACFGRTNIDRIELPKSPSHIGPSTSSAPRIDPKFINNPELSDVQFRVEGRTFYAHKLVLVTASSRFASMLGSRFCEGTPPVLQINDIRYDIFHLVMVYLYNGGARSLHQVEAGDVLELMAAANFFQLPGLLCYCESRCSHLVDLDNIVSYYIHAKVYNATQLLAYCEGFLLQNMVALLTYDDSVKRLLFGKKLQNHDVLSGLLFTLQNRVKTRNKK